MTSKLKEAREKAGYTIEQVSEILKIRKHYIVSIEEENFSNIPSPVYVRGYTKAYHEFLGLPFIEAEAAQPAAAQPDYVETKGNIKKIVTIISIIGLIIVIIGYPLIKNYYISLDDVTDNTTIKKEIDDNGSDQGRVDYSD